MKRDLVLLRGFYEKTLLSSYSTFYYPKCYISCIFYHFAVCAIAVIFNILYLGIDSVRILAAINFYLQFSQAVLYEYKLLQMS